MEKGKKFLIFTFLLPAILLYLINVIYPVIASVFYSLLSWDGIGNIKYIGLGNFIELFKSPVFYQSCKNTFYAVIGGGFIQVAIALILATVLNSGVKFYKTFRTVYFFPVLISSVSMALMFTLIYDPYYGMLNFLLKGMGLDSLTRIWLGDRNVVIFAALFPQIWQSIGFTFIILLAGLQNIPSDIIEYSSLDGVSGFKRLFYIELPLIWEIIQICVIFGVVGALKSFEHVFIMTQGGPMHASELLSTYMYNMTFKAMRFGYGSSISFMIFILGFGFTAIFKKYFSGETIQY